MRLASMLSKATELTMISAPWRRSALWKVVRVDGVDFVLRCPYTAVPGFACDLLDAAWMSIVLVFCWRSARRGCRSAPTTVPLLPPLLAASRTLLRLLDAS